MQTHFRIFSKAGIILAIGFTFVFPFLFGTSAFGHGLGGENLPVSLENRNATLFLSIQPPIFDPTSNESYLTINLTDEKTSSVIEHVTFMVELSKDGKQIFKEKIHDDLGNVNIKLLSTNSNQIKIDGDKEPTTGGWTRKLFSPLTIEGPVFPTGGLYKFCIEIITVDSDQNVLSETPKLDGAISIAEKTIHPITDINEKKYDISITSYYDRINNFAFDAKDNIISFQMPFDWSKKNINQTTVVHQEIHIPKTFAEMLVTKYDATLNGIPLKESSVTIDDYSEDARIVHLVVNQNDLSEMSNDISEPKMDFTVMPSKHVKFPLQANTGNAQFQVGLSWDPPTIYPRQNIEFYVDFNELFSDKKPKTVTYDFVLTQSGNEIFRKKATGQTNSPTKTNIEEYNFSQEDLGSVIVSIEKINNNEYATASFVAVVKPIEKPRQTFPIRLASSSQTGDGSYFVDLTWIPLNLTPREESEFIITVYDKQTLMPIPQAEYDFVIVQNDKELFRKSGIAQAGGSFVNFRFSESDVGSAILRIENIDKSSEYAEIPIGVTPEFPASALIVFAATLSGMMIIPALRRKLIAQS